MGWLRQRWTGTRRGLGYLLWSLPSVVVTFLLFGLTLLGAMSTVLAGLGLVVLPVLLVALRRWTDLHRRLAGSLLGTPIPARYRPLPGGLFARLRQVLTDRTTWRDLGWSLTQIIIGLPLGGLALIVIMTPPLTVGSMLFWWVPDEPVSLVAGIPLTSWTRAIWVGLLNLVLVAALALPAVPPLARAHARLTRMLLGASATEQLAERVDVLTQTRAGAIDAHGAELARIERDLHDGTQARLVAIAMRLGIAREELAGTTDTTAARLVKEAYDGTEAAMRELRAIIRTMYPPVLADLGLGGALHALAAQSAVPTTLQLGELGQPPAAVEAAAYFAISEALTNVAKHSRATAATVEVRAEAGWLAVTVSDNGSGGVDESLGSGLTGIRQRIAALDGSVEIDGPAGGPTTIAVRLPCES